MPSGIAVIGLVIMSRIMGGTGQTDVLADGISRVLGKAYAILSPVVGLIGTFMTASNMSSNILFGRIPVHHCKYPASERGCSVRGSDSGRRHWSSYQPKQDYPGNHYRGNPWKRGRGFEEDHADRHRNNSCDRFGGILNRSRVRVIG